MIYIGFWKRFIAFIIDLIICAAASFVFVRFFVTDDKTAAGAGLTIIFLVLYPAILEASSLQASFGKLAMGIKVSDEYGYRISLLRSLARSFIKVLSLNFFPFLLVICAFTKNKQNVHDFAVNSFVIYNYIYENTDCEEFRYMQKRKTSFSPAVIAVICIFCVLALISPVVYFFSGINRSMHDIEKRAAQRAEENTRLWSVQNINEIGVSINVPVKLELQSQGDNFLQYTGKSNTATVLICRKYPADALSPQEQAEYVLKWVTEMFDKKQLAFQRTEEPVNISGLEGVKYIFTGETEESYNAVVAVLKNKQDELFIISSVSKVPFFAKNINEKILNSATISDRS